MKHMDEYEIKIDDEGIPYIVLEDGTFTNDFYDLLNSFTNALYPAYWDTTTDTDTTTWSY